MKISTNTIEKRRHTGMLLMFVLILTLMMAAFVPSTSSVVYGESTTSTDAIEIYTVTFIDMDKKILSEQKVEKNKDAVPPTVPEHKGYKFLGWDNYYINVDSDRTINAVYELVMTTTKEEKGKLAKPATAKPPKEETPAQDDISTTTTVSDNDTADTTSDSSIDATETSEDAITSPSVIKPEDVPKDQGTGNNGTDGGGLTPMSWGLIILGAAIAVGLASYFIVMYRKKRNNDTYTS